MLESVRKIGIITKGIIYSLVGVLTFLAAINMGGQVSGKNKVIDFLENQTFGKVLVILIGAGLVMYAFWRLYSAFLDGKNAGSNKKGIVKRIGYGVSGIIYGFLAYSVFASSAQSSGNSKSSAARTLMKNDGGVYLLYLLGVILFCLGIYQFYKGFSEKFLENIEQTGQVESKKILTKTGKFGYIARGISFIIFGIFVGIAAYEKNAEAIKGMKEMFSFLQNFSFGNVLMALMSVGLFCYGVYQYFLARYSSIY